MIADKTTNFLVIGVATMTHEVGGDEVNEALNGRDNVENTKKKNAWIMR